MYKMHINEIDIENRIYNCYFDNFVKIKKKTETNSKVKEHEEKKV